MAEGEFPQKYHPMRKEERKGRKGADSSVIEELSAFAHVRPMRRSTVRSPLEREGGREEGADMPEMRTTPAPARAPNEVNDAGQKKSVAKRRLGRGGRERPLPVNRAASRRSPAR